MLRNPRKSEKLVEVKGDEILLDVVVGDEYESCVNKVLGVIV